MGILEPCADEHDDSGAWTLLRIGGHDLACLGRVLVGLGCGFHVLTPPSCATNSAPSASACNATTRRVSSEPVERPADTEQHHPDRQREQDAEPEALHSNSLLPSEMIAIAEKNPKNSTDQPMTASRTPPSRMPLGIVKRLSWISRTE